MDKTFNDVALMGKCEVCGQGAFTRADTLSR